MRRWLLRILALLIILLILAAAAIQCVLWSDYPRQIVITQIQQATGLRVHIGELQTGWSGRTTLDDLALFLPTAEADAPLAKTTHVQADHAWLLAIVLRGDLGLRSIHAPQLHVELNQDATGQWNWQRAIDLIAAHSSDDSSAGALPKVTIDTASVAVTDAAGRSRTYDHITFTADPLPPTAMHLNLTVGDQLSLAGRVNAVGDMHHELTLTANHLDALLPPFIDTTDFAPASGELHILGAMHGPSYTARLDAKQIHLGKYEATGTLAMTVAEAVTFTPIALNITTGNDRLGTIQLTGGRLSIHDSILQATALQAAARDTAARITGTWNLLESRGQLAADWIGELTAQKANHHGSLTAELRKLAADRWHLQTTIASRGSLDAGPWEAAAGIVAEGDPAGALTWSVQLDRGQFTPADGSMITLDRAGASGHVDVPQRRWTATASIDDFKTPGDDRPVDIQLTAAGDEDKVTIRTLKLTRADGSIAAQGEYTFAADQPLNLEATASFKHALDDPSRPDVPPWAATAQWTGAIRGTLDARPHITADGKLDIDGLTVNGQAIDPISITSTARWTGGELSLSTDPFQVLGGSCTASGAYTPDTMTTQLKLTLDKIALATVATVVNPELAIEGVASAQLQVHVPRGLVEHVRAEGDWEVENFQRGEIAFDRMTGRLSTRGKVLRLDPIVLLKDSGRAEGRVLFNLTDGHTLRAELKPQRWPLNFEAAGLTLAVDGELSLDVDITEEIVTGSVDLQSDIAVEAGATLGRLAVVGQLDEKSLKLSEIHGTLGAGEVGGEANLDLTDWSQSTGLITVKSISPTALSAWQAPLSKIGGKLNATVQFAPADDPRAPEPLRLDVNWSPADDAIVIQRLHFGAGSLIAYTSPRRTIIDESTIALAQGQVKAWASFSPHAGQWYNHLRLALHDLDTHVIAEAIRTEPGPPVPGKLSGHFNAIGPVGDWQALVGRGELKLADSNFVNTDILGGIMNLIGSHPTDPVGYGNLQARLERGMIVIDQFKYANRSTEILLDGVIQDITQGMQSPIKLNALGSVRPFKGLPILGSDEIDRMIRGFESNLSSVRVDGTLEIPNVRSTTFAQTASTIKKLLTNQQKQQTN